jgi:hypothetical protein
MLEVLVMTIVTLPALADSEVLSNLSAPFGSAAIFRTVPPPALTPPLLLLVVLELDPPELLHCCSTRSCRHRRRTPRPGSRWHRRGL